MKKPAFTARRVLSKQEAASYIGRSPSWFADHEEDLYAEGFPRQLPGILGGYDLAAIDRWLDGLGGNLAATASMGCGDAWTRACNGSR